MIEPVKYKYTVVLIAENKKQYDITDFIENVTWEEPDGELAARLSFTAKNDKTAKGQLSALAKPGCYIGYLYSYDGKKNNEAVRGKIVEWNPSARSSEKTLRVKAYDLLYDLQESEDNIYFSSGMSTKSALTQILGKWGIKIAKYSGPNVKHGKIVHKKEKLGTVVFKILEEAKKRGGKDAVVRAVKNTVNILALGSNTTVYHIEEKEHLIEVDHKISTAGMITRVKIIGKEKKDGNAPVEATVDGQTKYGIRQKIYTRDKDESLSEAKQSGKEILKEQGKAKEDITIKLPDIPVIRKGDQIHLKTSSVKAGYYYVVSALHDVDSMSMTLDLKKASDKKDDDKKDDDEKKDDEKDDDEKNAENKTYKEGDIVNFKGGNHYVSSYKGSKGYYVNAGKAKIHKINKGAAHPWCLITQNWSISHVWGWVDDGTFD